MNLDHYLHIVQVPLIYAGAQFGALAVFWFLVYRLHRVRWAGSRSRDELRLFAGRAGFIRIVTSGGFGHLLGTALMYRSSMAADYGSRLGYVAWEAPVVLGAWALIGWMCSTDAKKRLDNEDAGQFPK